MNGGRLLTRKRILVGLFIFCFVILVGFIVTHSIVIVSVGGETTALYRKSGQNTNQTARSGIQILSTGDYVFTGQKGISSVKKELSLKSLHINRVSLDPEPQKKAIRVGRGASDCMYGSLDAVAKKQIYSYDCSEPKEIYKNIYIDNVSTKSTIDGPIEATASQITQYKDGVVGLGAGEGGTSLVSLSDKPNLHTLPDELKNTLPENVLVTADENGVFVFDKNSGKMYTFSSLSDSPKITTLKFPKGINISSASQAKAHNGKIYILFGEVNNTEAASDSFEKGYLVKYNVKSDSIESTIKLDNDADYLLGFDFVDEKYIVATGLDQKTRIYNVSGKNIELVDTLGDTFQSVVSDNKIYVLISGDIYRYSPNEKLLAKVFGSEKLAVTKLHGLERYLTFNAIQETDSSGINLTYLLTNEDLRLESRPEDILSYSDTELPILWSDYGENQVVFALNLDSLQKDPATGSYKYNQSEFNEKSATINSSIDKDALAKLGYTVRVSPY